MQEESSDFIHDLGCDDELAAVTDGERYFAFAAGDFDKARIAFACAWPVVRSPLVLFELAVAEEQSDVLAGAFAHFRELLTFTAADAEYMRALTDYDSHDARSIEEMRARAEDCIASLRPPMATERVSVQATTISSDRFLGALGRTHVAQPIDFRRRQSEAATRAARQVPQRERASDVYEVAARGLVSLGFAKSESRRALEEIARREVPKEPAHWTAADLLREAIAALTP